MTTRGVALDWYEPSIGTSLLVLTISLVLVAVMVLAVRDIRRSDAERRTAMN